MYEQFAPERALGILDHFKPWPRPITITLYLKSYIYDDTLIGSRYKLSAPGQALGIFEKNWKTFEPA
jgi:hypothetical protein